MSLRDIQVMLFRDRINKLLTLTTSANDLWFSYPSPLLTAYLYSLRLVQPTELTSCLTRLRGQRIPHLPLLTPNDTPDTKRVSFHTSTGKGTIRMTVKRLLIPYPMTKKS